MPADKASTRQTLRQLRNDLSLTQRRTAETQALSLLNRWPAWHKARVIASYLPHQSEFDPSCLSQQMSSQGATIVYPRVTDDGLRFHCWRSGDPLETTIGGVNQPLAASPPVTLSQIDLFITPMLACGGQWYSAGLRGWLLRQDIQRGTRLQIGSGLFPTAC
jgi:5-formyltetrahydrofolate cyclo-ligase